MTRCLCLLLVSLCLLFVACANVVLCAQELGKFKARWMQLHSEALMFVDLVEHDPAFSWAAQQDILKD